MPWGQANFQTGYSPPFLPWLRSFGAASLTSNLRIPALPDFSAIPFHMPEQDPQKERPTKQCGYHANRDLIRRNDHARKSVADDQKYAAEQECADAEDAMVVADNHPADVR